jgi:hypothetical protein
MHRARSIAKDGDPAGARPQGAIADQKALPPLSEILVNSEVAVTPSWDFTSAGHGSVRHGLRGENGEDEAKNRPVRIDDDLSVQIASR